MKARILFLGTPQFAVPSLQDLVKGGCQVVGVVTQPDKPRGRGQKVSCSEVKEAALSLGLNVYQPETVKDASFLELLKELKPDLLAVVAYGRILPKSILDFPPLGCINLHASLLPRYRGAAPIQWALLNGESITGATTMLMNEGMDTGDILEKVEIPIPEEMSFGELHDILAERGAGLLLHTVELWQEGRLTPLPQDNCQATYAPMLTREHEKINWNLPARAIHNQIRGLDPWPGAYTLWGDQPLKIRKASVYEENSQAQEAGTVLKTVKGQGFVVQAKVGSLLVQSVQPYGKKTMPADSFVNGYRLEVGYAFIPG